MSETPAAVQPKPEEGAGADQAAGFGLPVAIALIMGSIIGVGIFNLPTSWPASGRSPWSRWPSPPSAR